MKNKLIEIWMILKSPIISFLKRRLTKFLIAKFIRSAWMLDVRLWLIDFLVDYLSDQVLKPAIDYFFRKAGYQYEVENGRHLLKKIAAANTVDEWRDLARGV